MAVWFQKNRTAHLWARLPINPVPASRPRVTRWGTYYGKKYTDWMKSAAKDFLVQGDGPLEGPLAVMVEQVIAKPRTSERDYPVGDVDNYVKAPLDALTKLERVWHDDDQVVLLVASKRFAVEGEQPFTWVGVSPL